MIQDHKKFDFCNYLVVCLENDIVVKIRSTLSKRGANEDAERWVKTSHQHRKARVFKIQADVSVDMKPRVIFKSVEPRE